MEKKNKKRSIKPRSLGDLVSAVFDEVSQMTDDMNLASRVTAREVGRWLVQSGRPDLARRLAAG